ncbi:MAG: acetylglutamate kinase [Christensenellales bacterium]|jgi:acetylglutamate kinase
MNRDSMIAKANMLTEALAYINRLSGKTVVIKYGGHAMNDEFITKTILEDIVTLKIVGVNPILVHGGGPSINNMLNKLNIESKFNNGLRVTDAATMEVVQMVLCGKINKDITGKLNIMGVKAIGLSGKDARLIEVVKSPNKNGVDLGFVGDIVNINVYLLEMLAKDEFIPVIASVGVDKEGNSYNINADTVAGEVAAALKAEKLIFLTDTDGIRRNPDDPDSICSELSVDEVLRMIEDNVITGGMIPKVMGCLKGIEKGISRTHIISGMVPHPILLEIFTDKGIGTMIRK